MKVLIVLLITIFCSEIIASEIPDSTTIDNEYSIEELMNIKVKVSSFNAKNVFNTPSSVTVISSDEISKYSYQSVQEALRMKAGIDVYYTVLDQNVVTSRGILQNFYANKILFLINGVPTWQPIYGNANVERININDVERIEILKGPASVLYGTNAFTGVVNIILHDNKAHLAFKNDFNAFVRVDRPKGASAGANVMFKEDAFEFYCSLNVGMEDKDPYVVQSKRGSSIFNADKYDSSYYYYQKNRYYNLNLSLVYGNHNLNINDYVYEHTFPGIDPSYKQGGGTMFNDNGILVSYNYQEKFIDDKLNIKATAAYDYFTRYYPDSYDRVTELRLAGARLFSSVQSDYKITDNINLELGFDLDERISKGHQTINILKDSIIRSNLKDDKNILEWSPYFQSEINFENFSVLGGIRYTNNQISGGDLSSRFTCVYSIRDKQSIKIIYGQSFRSPQMLELYFDHPTVVGNPDLKPEKCNSTELAYLIGTNNIFIQSIVYFSSYSNLIQRITPVTGPPSQYRNVGKFDSYGFELEFKYDNASLINLFLNYNFMEGVGGNSGDNFKYVPKHTLRFGINKSFNPVFISFNGYACSKVKGNLEDIPLQGYVDAVIGFTQKLENSNLNLTHSLTCKNIFDSDMLTPEYIRMTPNINSLASMGFGRTFSYILKINY